MWHSLIALAMPNTPAVTVQDLNMHKFCEASSENARSRFERRNPSNAAANRIRRTISIRRKVKNSPWRRSAVCIKKRNISGSGYHPKIDHMPRLSQKVALQHHPATKSDPPTSAKTSKNTNSARLPQNWQVKISAILCPCSYSYFRYAILSYSKLSNYCQLLYSQLFLLSATLSATLLSATCCQLPSLSATLLIVWANKSSYIGGFPTKIPYRKRCACM